jgi:hypothetical protein
MYPLPFPHAMTRDNALLQFKVPAQTSAIITNGAQQVKSTSEPS